MGLLAAALNSAGGVLADQWKEYFYCESMPNDILVMKGQKRISKRSSNTKGNDNVITDGSGIAVADGQCMIIVENGMIVDVCSEPGEYTYRNNIAPSFFTGGLGSSIKNTIKEFGKRVSYGGQVGSDQRIYYVNIKEITDNKFGTPSPVPFRVVDSRIGLDVDVSLRCSGLYSYRISDPVLFYVNVCGNVVNTYDRNQIDKQLKTEFLSSLQQGFSKLSDMEIRPNQIVAHNDDLTEAMDTILSKKWGEIRGIDVVSVALGSVTLPPEDAEMIKTLQKTAVFTNLNMAAASTVEAKNEAMKMAASNSAGAMTGFMGMNMAQSTGGLDASALFQMGQQAAPQQAPAQQAKSADSWTCSCGAVNTGKFCMECGTPKPVMATEWTCSCGTVNKGKFCMNCGSPRPATEWTCSCGTVNKGKFCMNCGSPRP